MTPEQILELLHDRRDDELIGLEESTTFDAKSESYRLDDAKSKWELAKDVSAMANASGGLLLVGARTEIVATSLVERVSAIRPVQSSFINEEKIRSAIKNMVFPSINLYVEVHRFVRDDDKVMLAIHVRRPPDDDLPVLVASRATITVGDRTHEIEAFALARRVGAGTEWDQGAKVWSDIRDGRLARRNLMLQASPTPPVGEERLSERLDVLLGHVGVQDHAYLALIATPDTAVSLAGFASGSGVHGLLKSLPQDGVRQMGFGLGYGLDPQPVGSGLVDVGSERRGILVDPDGLIVAVALGTREMLGWADTAWLGDSDTALRINSYVLVEWSLEFARFVDRVRQTAPATAWTWHAHAHGLSTGHPPLALRVGTFEVATPRVDRATASGQLTDPGETAFEIVRWFTELFGETPDQVPGVVDGRVDADAIRAWGANG
jgi:hypothetical protein